MSGKGKQSSKKAVAKIRESGKTAQPSTANSDPSSEVPEPTTSHVLLKTVDLPRYTNILKRTADEGIVMDDLDTLQLELETLLSAVVVRHSTLQNEIASLFSAEERRDRRSKSGKSLSLLDKKIREEKLKSKEIGAKSQSPLHTKLCKQKTVGSSTSQVAPNLHETSRIEGSKSDVSKLLLPENDTPNKFWASVDPYCTDIMPDDVKLLEELIASHGDISEFKEIPSLGTHYSSMWAHNDLLQEEDAANPNREKKKNRTSMSHLISKGDKKTNSIAGPLTHRLVSALLEENVYIASNKSNNKSNNMENKFRNGDPPVLRDLTIQNSVNLELRVRKELVEQGILEPDAPKKNQEDDEIFAEIKRCQQELNALSNHNVTQLKRLLNLAQEESKRQALKRKIGSADKDVIEHYKNLTLAKQGKIELTEEDHKKAWTCLRERENLLEQLNVIK